jgi:hypothetical protein
MDTQPYATLEILNAYRLFQKISEYPKLTKEMRDIFLASLENRKITSEQALRNEAEEWIGKKNGASTSAMLQENLEALIDLHFAKHFSEEEIRNHINQARRNDRLRHLYQVINSERATPFKIKNALAEFCVIPEGEPLIPPSEAEGIRVALINYFISDQLPFVSVAKQYLSIQDINEMLEHMILSRRQPGKAGGKAAGMFLANKILFSKDAGEDPDLSEHLGVPESYYFNSGIFSDFIDYNGFHHLHSQKYKSKAEIEEDYQKMAGDFERALFPPDVEEAFRKFLIKIGTGPLILRPSSLLEDHFGRSFSGKYDSVLIPNQGDIGYRLREFIGNLKRVLMSTFSPAPLLFRRDHHILDFDERLGVLVQKAVGRRFGDYFFPFTTGIAYSFNPFSQPKERRREEGLARLVLGMGTRALNRAGQEYALPNPLEGIGDFPENKVAALKNSSQKMIAVFNLASGKLQSLSYSQFLNKIQFPDLSCTVFTKESGQATPSLQELQQADKPEPFIAFEHWVARSPLMVLLKKALLKLEKAYGGPVDIEFVWDDEKLYVLQCRSLLSDEQHAVIEEQKEDRHNII